VSSIWPSGALSTPPCSIVGAARRSTPPADSTGVGALARAIVSTPFGRSCTLTSKVLSVVG
jgi:hypothetical protein